MTNNSSPIVPLNKILYVEDDEDIVFITKMALEDIGKMQVQCCTSGKAALACATSFDPQLFLFDVMMPEMDGVMLLLEFRKSPQFAQTPVIFLTAKSLAQEIDAYRKLGVLDIIVKPFDPTTLAAILQEKWMNYQRARTRSK